MRRSGHGHRVFPGQSNAEGALCLTAVIVSHSKTGLLNRDRTSVHAADRAHAFPLQESR